ncbi:MAG: chemotaxis-specific protein-glutamate methyltransferase CheB [Alphaproteobacteria bacterium]|nr:chemotaxis-specific protein-glutamate methyltransferase CheB [Alphaproteobacteria bacterium]
MSVPRVRVLVVHDAATDHQAWSHGLASDPRMEVVGAARDAWEARGLIVEHDPHVIVLDLEMPRLDGVDFLRRLMTSHPVRAVVVSSVTPAGSRVAMDALHEGAVEVVARPMTPSELRTKVLIASTARLQRPTTATGAPLHRALADSTQRLVAIGASSGGTEALRQVLSELPPHFPGIAIVQHMPPGFTAPFAARLAEVSRFEVKEAEDGDRLFPGRCVVAPAGRQLRVVRSGADYVARLGETTKVSGYVPSVDVMFHSVAAAAGAKAVGVVLTGMGADGADGLGAMRKAGSRTFAQDEASSVVWGMPRAAWEAGAAERLIALPKVAEALMGALEEARPPC